MRIHASTAVALVLTVGLGVAAPTQPTAAPAVDPLLQGFQDPPTSARPRVWWHWMNGNITQEGIRLDLEWMKRVGIGGFQNFDAALATPQVVPKRLAYMTPEWDEAFRFAADLAEQDGLEMAIASSPGWSESGGPWVKPEEAIKKLVWSETDIPGGQRFKGKLANPPAVPGPFQDVPAAGEFGDAPRESPRFYRDISVLAYASPDVVEPHATVSVAGQLVGGQVLNDGSLAKGVMVKLGASNAASCITFAYDKPTSITSLTLGLPVGGDFFRSPLAFPVLEASNDGVTFRKVSDVPSGGFVQHTISFHAVSGRQFRVCFRPPPAPYSDLLEAAAPGVDMSGPFGSPGTPTEGIEVLELRLFTTPQVNRFEAKAGFELVPDYYAIPTEPVAASETVAPMGIVDLTSRMKADGTLDWSAPPGRWKVVRFGYSLTGSVNHPATAEATGLEVDKLDRAHVKSYIETYLEKYQKLLGPTRMGGQGVRALLTDSIESGSQNWTESLPAEFKRRRGYDLTQWMPTLTGVIEGSAAETDRFLYDFRRTIAELISDSHYAQIAESAKARGLTLYGESLEQGRPVLGDDMEMRRYTSVPMAAMWAYSAKQGNPTPTRYADIRGAASVAHIYGQNLVAAESLTSAFAPWNFAPRDLKPMIDMEFLLGVNRPVIHTSVHQPLVDKGPGLRLAIFGQDFNRNETWAEQAGAWVSYLSRTAYMLQQGRFAADVLYFYGEEAPLTALYGDHLTPDAPVGYGFDFANTDVLLNRVKVSNGSLVTDSGMRYRLLYLGGSSLRMTLPVLKRIQALVNDGATVVGQRPIESPSLTDDQHVFQNLAESIWSPENSAAGRVMTGVDANTALQRLGVPADFEYRKPQADSEILFLHRHLQDGELYFVSNRKPTDEQVEATFNTVGRQPEIWHAESGKSEPVSYRIENGRTVMSLRFTPYDSFFVTFRRPDSAAPRALPDPITSSLANLAKGWTVSFQPGRGAATSPHAIELGSWTQASDPAIRYFSGTGIYTHSISVPSAWKHGHARLSLDLGEVRELAEVLVNGRSLGILWHPPYRVDVGDALHVGDNRLEVRVTNLWVNRLIGDAQPGAERVTFTVGLPYRADAPLRESGLLGPVRLEQVTEATRNE